MKLLNKLRPLMLPLVQINSALPESGKIYEIGCGAGGLAYALTLSKRQVIGIDKDEIKIAQGKKFFKNKNLTLVNSDALLYDFDLCNGVVMSDFLHHLNYESQEKLLVRVSKIIKTGGTLIIKEIDKADGVRKYMSRLWDYILYPKDAIYYRTKNEWSTLLNRLGFTTKLTRTVNWFPGSTYLYICTKKG